MFVPLYIIAICAVITAIAAIIVVRSGYANAIGSRRSKRINTLFTNITHEVLTPLTIISASVEHLREKEPKFSNDYDLMELNIQRTVRLLQQILEASKSQAGELKLLVANGDVMSYIKNTAMCIEPLMVKHGLQFTVHCEPESMLGWIDTDKLDKIIFNLLSNAAKYAGDNGEVSLTVKTNNRYDHVHIEVKDNGVGIPKDKIGHLFERFFDGDYRHMHTIGTGIGLSLTRDLVRLHRGTIVCESREGYGTTFMIDLPIHKEAFDASQIDEKHPISLEMPENNIADFANREFVFEEDSSLSPEALEDAYKVLIVEDNLELLMLMTHLLRTKYCITTARDGVEALEKLRTKEQDLIISDVMMPRMDGNKLTKVVKADPDLRHLPIILLTAKTQEEDKKKSLKLGADDYITKPFKMSDLQLRIDNIIANRKRIQNDFHEKTIEEVSGESEGIGKADSEFLKRATECVMNHLDDAEYNRDLFASDMGASASTLYNKLRSITGSSVSSFIRDIRMKEARRIIESETDIRVSDLAYRVGFKDPKYFATIFKKEFGVQPSEFISKNEKL